VVVTGTCSPCEPIDLFLCVRCGRAGHPAPPPPAHSCALYFPCDHAHTKPPLHLGPFVPPPNQTLLENPRYELWIVSVVPLQAHEGHIHAHNNQAQGCVWRSAQAEDTTRTHTRTAHARTS
jgi:hypothetical protein